MAVAVDLQVQNCPTCGSIYINIQDKKASKYKDIEGEVAVDIQ